MKISDSFVAPDADLSWTTPQDFGAAFDWRYDTGRARLMSLYQKGKDLQWDALARIDWTQELDPENPMQLPDELDGVYHTPIWGAASERFRAEIRQHMQAWTISQFLHGEQAALICAAKIVQQAPDLDAKFYASTQVVDEARHVEVFKAYLAKFDVAYPMTKPLQSLIAGALSDQRWDMTYLAMQVVIEGLALASFANIRTFSQNRLTQQINAFVMQDEARHVAFGRISLGEFYPQLTEAERAEREDFLIAASYAMRDQLMHRDVYETLGLPADECIKAQLERGFMQAFRAQLFQRIVPIVRDIGLWSPKIQKAYADMGVLGFADLDPDALALDDDRAARELEEARDERGAYVDQMIAQGANAA